MTKLLLPGKCYYHRIVVVSERHLVLCIDPPVPLHLLLLQVELLRLAGGVGCRRRRRRRRVRDVAVLVYHGVESDGWRGAGDGGKVAEKKSRLSVAMRLLNGPFKQFLHGKSASPFRRLDVVVLRRRGYVPVKLPVRADNAVDGG
jgi:hypothetical protein